MSQQRSKNQQTTTNQQNGYAFQRVLQRNKAHKKILQGAEILATAVKSTMGPSGHSVIIDNDIGGPTITKDGVTVAKSINLKDRVCSMGAELLKEVASKTNERAGDGTTTATVLAYALLSGGHRMIDSGRDSIELKTGMDAAYREVIEFLKSSCIPIANKNDIINVATISANGDKEIGALIADAIKEVGSDGLITIEPAKSVNTTLKLTEGIQIDSGFLSPFFITNGDKQICELENPYILITANKITSLSEILPVLDKIDTDGKPLLIVADDVEGDALHTLVVNKTKGVIKVCAIKAPSYGEYRADILSDLGIVVNGSVLGATSELSLKNVKLEDLGKCKKAIINRKTTTLVIDEKNEEVSRKIQARIESIKTALETDKTLDQLRASKFRERLAKLSGGIAVIQVGGSTEVEIFEKKDRVEDAVNATQAAVQEGIVPGGGTALFYAAQHIRNLLKTGFFAKESKLFSFGNFSSSIDEDYVSGILLIADACEAPFKTIVENTGESAEVVGTQLLQNWTNVKKFFVDLTNVSQEDVADFISTMKKKNPEIPEKEKFRYGYDASTKSYGDLIDLGICDPVKVTRYALEHSVSVIGLLLTCDAVVVNEDDEDNSDNNQ
jgi:chaperonin GroEL